MSQEVPAPRGLRVAEPSVPGSMLALATMSDRDFEDRLATLKQGQDRIRRIKTELMIPGTHYGVIPGTDKPTLLKPGAEVLCSIYGLVAGYVDTVTYGDGVLSPIVSVKMRCELHQGDLEGPIVAVGIGAANSWERKHRYRRAQRSCPDCGTVGSIRKSKFPDRETGDIGWYCREESCKRNFDSGDPEIIDQAKGDVENPDQYDLENTLLKMAKKRAHIDGALTGTASSDLFTQDIDETLPHEEPVIRRDRMPQGEEVVETSAGPVVPGSGAHAAAAGAPPNPTYVGPRPTNSGRSNANGARSTKRNPVCPKHGGTDRVIPSKQNPGHLYCLACKHDWIPEGGQA